MTNKKELRAKALELAVAHAAADEHLSAITDLNTYRFRLAHVLGGMAEGAITAPAPVAEYLGSLSDRARFTLAKTATL